MKRTREVVSSLERYLSVTQFGITLASLGLGWIGEPALERIVDHLFTTALGRDPGRVGHVIGIVISFTLLTFAHVLFGELVPKLIAIQRSERIAYLSSAPLRWISIAFRPLLWVLERTTRLVLRAMGMSESSTSEGQLSEEELVGILAAQAAQTPGGKEMADHFKRVTHFAARHARHVMVPRVDIFSLSETATGEEAIRQLRQHQFSRVPLAKEKNADEIVGYVYAKDCLLDPNVAKLSSLRGVMREILFVPETASLLKILADMQKSQIPIAIVVDEYGGTSGLVTMEDLLEEIVGEIRDELDVEHARVVKVPGETEVFDVDAKAAMEELRAAGVTVGDNGAEQVGIVVLHGLGRIPRVGDKVEIASNATAEITSVSRRRIIRVRVRVIPPSVEST